MFHPMPHRKIMNGAGHATALGLRQNYVDLTAAKDGAASKIASSSMKATAIELTFPPTRFESILYRKRNSTNILYGFALVKQGQPGDITVCGPLQRSQSPLSAIRPIPPYSRRGTFLHDSSFESYQYGYGCDVWQGSAFRDPSLQS
jgi:hypothetical protein